jgi:hypothetical protein
MKKFLLILFVAVLATGCEKECKTMMVVRDCTGTYLRAGGEDRYVCNANMLAGYADGATVDATYHSVNTCHSDEVVCMMLHPHEGWIEVDAVK